MAVARALAGNPAISCADEPAASLDRDNADHLLNDLFKIADNQNKTLIIVSHDQTVLNALDQTIEVLDGVVIS